MGVGVDVAAALDVDVAVVVALAQVLALRTAHSAAFGAWHSDTASASVPKPHARALTARTMLTTTLMSALTVLAEPFVTHCRMVHAAVSSLKLVEPWRLPHMWALQPTCQHSHRHRHLHLSLRPPSMAKQPALVPPSMAMLRTSARLARQQTRQTLSRSRRTLPLQMRTWQPFVGTARQCVRSLNSLKVPCSGLPQ